METETAVQLNLGFESSRENIGQTKFASNRDDQNSVSFLENRFGSSRNFARNLLLHPDQLWKVVLALAVLIIVLFASIAMLMHFAASTKQSSSPSDKSKSPLDNDNPTALSWKLTGEFLHT